MSNIPVAPEGIVRPQYTITASQDGEILGTITIELLPDVAPKHVANFEKLAAEGIYDGSAFHRVIPGFMIQGGDPNSKNLSRDMWGFGDQSLDKVPAEFNNVSHERGILSAARSTDPNSASSQFFICVSDATFLDRQYSVYGYVTEGMDVADRIVNAPRDSRDNPHSTITMVVAKV